MPEKPAVPVVGSVEGVVSAVQAATELLPQGDIDTSQRHVQVAATMLAHSIDSDSGATVHRAVATAAERGSTAATAASVAQANLESYVQRITGGGTMENSREASVEALRPPRNTAIEQGPITPVITNERRLGDASVKGVLVTHTVENAPLIAQAVQDCEVVIIEAPGIKDAANRAENQRLYSTLISGQVDPGVAEQVFNALPHDTLIQIMRRLARSDKQVVLIDMNADDPDYPLIETYLKTRRQLIGDVVDVKPLASLRAAALAAVDAQYHSYNSRNSLMSQQLEAKKSELATGVPV